jgi:hypothetical protein
MSESRYKASLWQDGMEVASVDCPDRDTMLNEINHYALIYGQDGIVDIRIDNEPKPTA